MLPQDPRTLVVLSNRSLQRCAHDVIFEASIDPIITEELCDDGGAVVGGGGSRAFDELQRKLPKEKKKLFRSDFLNNHPIMLEYLAAGVLHGETGGGEEVEEVA